MTSINKLHDSLFDEVIAVSFYHGTECISQLVDSQEAEQWEDKGFPADLLRYLCDIRKQTIEDYQKKIAEGSLSNPAKLVISADGFDLRALGFPVPVVGTRNSSSANYIESIVFFIIKNIPEISFHLLCDVTLDRFLEPVEFFDDQDWPDSAPLMTLEDLFRSLDTSGSRELTWESFCENAGTVFTQMRRRDLETAFQDILDVMGREQLADESSNQAVIDYLTFRRFVYGINNEDSKGFKKCTMLLRDLCQNCVEFSGYPENLNPKEIPSLMVKLKDCERLLSVMDKGLAIGTEGVSPEARRHWENSALRHRLRISTYRRIFCGVLETENEKLVESLEHSKFKEDDMAKLQAEKLDIEEKYMELANASEEQCKSLALVTEENQSLKKEVEVVKTGYSHQVIALDQQIQKKKKEVQELRDKTVDMSGQLNTQKKSLQNEIAKLEAKLKGVVEYCSELEASLREAKGKGINSHEEEIKALEEKFINDMLTREEKFKEELKQERIQIASEWEDEHLNLNSKLRTMQGKIAKHKAQLVEERAKVVEEWQDERELMIEKIKSLEKTLDVGFFESDGQEKLIEELRRQVDQSKQKKMHLAREERLHFETTIKELTNSKESLKLTISKMSNDLKSLQSSKDSQKQSLKRTISSLSDDIKQLKSDLSETQSKLEICEKQLREQRLSQKKTIEDVASIEDNMLQSHGNEGTRSYDSNSSEVILIPRSVSPLSSEREYSKNNESRLLKAKLIKMETAYQKLLQQHQVNSNAAQQKLSLEKQVDSLTNERTILEESLQKAKDDILRQNDHIKQLSDSREIITSQATSSCLGMQSYNENKENISTATLEKQHKHITNKIGRLQRKINAEDARLKKGMGRLEDIKKKRKMIKERRSTQRSALRKDRSQREFDDTMERLIHRVQDQNTEIVNLRKKLRKNNMAGDRSESDKKRIQTLSSDLKKTRTKIASLEVELIKAKASSRRRPTSTRESATSKRLKSLEKENKALQDQMQKIVLEVLQENRHLPNVNVSKWRDALQKLRIEEKSRLIAGGDIESGLENALQLLYSFFKECGPKELHETFDSIVDYIHEIHNKLRWLKQAEDEKENSAEMIFEETKGIPLPNKVCSG